MTKFIQIKNPNWQEADQLAIYKIRVEEKSNLGLPRTTSASGQNGISTCNLRIG